MTASVSTAVPSPKPGPLSGLKIVEMAGLGPVPLAGLILSELGATVLRVERLSKDQAFLVTPQAFDLDRHGREIVRLDLKHPEGNALMLRLLGGADCLIEGFRPGVMERLGLGPDVALARNPALIYGRMTGFGQDGPLAARAGHDLTYLALSGVLHAIGPKGGKPVPPLNLVADYGGGAMFLIVGLLAAVIERGRSGKGQVVDAAMVDGAGRICSIPERPSTTPTRRPTGMSQLPAWSRNSSPSSAACCRWMSVSRVPSTTQVSGPTCARPSRPASLKCRATNGRHCSKTPMPASLRCCRSGKRRLIRMPVPAKPMPRLER